MSVFLCAKQRNKIHKHFHKIYMANGDCVRKHLWCETTNETRNAKKPKEKEQKMIFLNAVYSNPLVWNTTESNLNAFISFTVNVVFVCISFQPLKCTAFSLKKNFFFVSHSLSMGQQCGFITRNDDFTFSLYHKLYTIHHSIQYELYENQQQQLSVMYMQCIRNRTIPKKCFQKWCSVSVFSI